MDEFASASMAPYAVDRDIRRTGAAPDASASSDVAGSVPQGQLDCGEQRIDRQSRDGRLFSYALPRVAIKLQHESRGLSAGLGIGRTPLQKSPWGSAIAPGPAADGWLCVPTHQKLISLSAAVP